MDGIFYRSVHFLLIEGLQESQHLHVLPLAPPSHSGLQQTPQRAELIGEFPALQGCGLVQSSRLTLQQRQVVDGGIDEFVSLV